MKVKHLKSEFKRFVIRVVDTIFNQEINLGHII